jgi:proteasome activator subunit 4
MFSKDVLSMGAAQASLHGLAMLEPALVMPEVLERAYGGLEAVHETHRTTAVLSTLSLVSLPLLSERIWVGGQRHVVPLLEMALPGIDLNDPAKTMCSAMFIVSVAQLIKIGDLSMEQSGLTLADDPPDVGMEVDEADRLPEGREDDVGVSKEEERILVRESTAAFSGRSALLILFKTLTEHIIDWVVSLFRRVFSLYENLPEEGGRKQTTGGKSEEAILKGIKSMLDVVCLHLSDSLFDLVLRLVYDYAVTNAKANAVRAFGQLVACLARVQPEKTLAKFLPWCLERIEDELKHGASSLRTTSSHEAVPSDTSLHWSEQTLAFLPEYSLTSLRYIYSPRLFGLWWTSGMLRDCQS